MEYFIEVRFDDPAYSAQITFAATIITKNEEEAELFMNELLQAFQRREVNVIQFNYNRIDNNPQLKEVCQQSYEYHLRRATASIEIEQFLLESPDQNKSLAENLMQKFFEGENATASIGPKYNIPVRVLDRKTGQPITADFYYFTVEHLIAKE